MNNDAKKNDAKKFLEAVLKDEGKKKELEAITAGLSHNDALNATVKFAASHGFNLTAGDFESEMQELSVEGLKAVVGGDGWWETLEKILQKKQNTY